MSTIRTPTEPKMTAQTTTPLNHYASDPQINISNCKIDNTDQFSFISRRTKRKHEEITEQGMSQLLNMLNDFSSKQDAKMANLNAAITTILEQNSVIQNTVEFISSKYDEMLLSMQKLQEVNMSYKKQINSLQAKIDMLEKSSCATKLEIRNVPKSGQENKETLTSIVKNIGTAVGLHPTLVSSEVRDIYRTKSSSIIIDLTTTTMRDSLIAKTKSFNKEMKGSKKPQLNTSHINIPGPTHTIYLSEHLTTRSKHIFFLARGLVKSKKIAACWTSYSKVYIRVAEGQPSLRVDSEEDLQKY
ncbi:uncharacterized protein LOC123689460 [Pieris rapae]|uniref:uncharacterized protein LOC123689460 n=1 Tax=Pieris rapae TaxID=64459 RepID=UPI001E27DEA6|nr:uncharacterized protein LOC123689460 [Pieris rapae]